MADTDWMKIPEITRPVDTIYAGPTLKEPAYTVLSQTVGTTTNLFILSPLSIEILDIYFQEHNQGRPFILISDDDGVLKEYLGSHPEHNDRLVSLYRLDSASKEGFREDVRTQIGDFIGTRTYCLRERVTEDLEE